MNDEPKSNPDLGSEFIVHRSSFIVSVLLFAAARDHAGTDSVGVDLPDGATVAVLRAELARKVPALATLLARSAVAVNHDFVGNDRVLTSEDEVAIIPPVSGG